MRTIQLKCVEGKGWLLNVGFGKELIQVNSFLKELSRQYKIDIREATMTR